MRLSIKNLDTNNLYGNAMSKFLPTNGFRWIDLKEFDLNKYTSNSSKGCFLEVDLEYSKELRELHNHYPLAPDKIEIKREMLAEYQLKIVDAFPAIFNKFFQTYSLYILMFLITPLKRNLWPY